MSQVTLFTDILPEEQERMRVCFRAKEICFQNNETILEYASSMNQIGVILYGRAVFGEPFLLPADSQNCLENEGMLAKDGWTVCLKW